LPSTTPYSEEVLQHFLFGFPGRELSTELAGLLAGGLAGVAIYPRNFSNLSELCRLTQAVRRAAGRPVLIGIDQEGGTKFSLGEPFTPWPSPAELGRVDDIDAVGRVARAIARELRAAGVTLDFAPMLDLATNPNSPVTSGRSFGAEPTRVAEMGCAFLDGLQEEGVLGCAKHFPGHGDADVDPHLDLPRFEGTRDRLMTREFVPFRAAIKAGVPLIMTAHLVLPKIDSEWPASLSSELLQSALRQQLGFDGVTLADDLGMGAIARYHKNTESVVRSLQAGSDIVMLCHDWNLVRPALEAAAQAISTLKMQTRTSLHLSQSKSRIARLRKRMADMETKAAPSRDVIGCAEHRAISAEIRARLRALR